MKPIEQIVVENNSFVIFAGQPKQPHEVMNFLAAHPIPFQVLLGSYKGELETSYIIPSQFLGEVIESGLLAEQESILILGAAGAEGTRKATLRYLATGEEIALGTLTRVTKEEALASEGFTFNPMLMSYFIVIPSAE